MPVLREGIQSKASAWVERDMKESRLGKAERRSPTRAGPGPEAEAQPLPKPFQAGGGAGESQGTHRLPAQSHSQSVFSKEVVSPVLSSVQARTGEGLDPAFRSPQAERGATAKHFNCPTGSRPSALSTKSVPSLLRNHSFGLQDTPSSPSSHILPKPTLQCVKQMAGT